MIKKKDKRFFFHKTSIQYEWREYKNIIVMDNHKYYLFKNPYYTEKWWIVDSETGVYVCRARCIDESYDKLYSMREKLQNIFQSTSYKDMKESYQRQLIALAIEPKVGEKLMD